MKPGRLLPASGVMAVIAVIALISGCDKLAIGRHAAVPDGAPDAQQLQKISYMSSSESAPHARKSYTHPEQARTCGDFELAMRWNRPPNVEAGAFHQKMVYLGQDIPSDLRKNSEVFIQAKIIEGQSLSSGGAEWMLRMKDGTTVQAIEMESFLDKQSQSAQDGKSTALVSPYTPGRMFCGTGVYEGASGKDPQNNASVPLISVLFAMDRKR